MLVSGIKLAYTLLSGTFLSRVGSDFTMTMEAAGSPEMLVHVYQTALTPHFSDYNLWTKANFKVNCSQYYTGYDVRFLSTNMFPKKSMSLVFKCVI